MIIEDRQACIDHSIALGYLSLEEGDEMIGAHVTTLYHLGRPFASDVFDFGSQVLRSLSISLIQSLVKPSPSAMRCARPCP